MKVAGPGTEDWRDSFFWQGQEGCSRLSEWTADHQPTVARRQSPDEVHLEAHPAKSGPKDLRGPVRRNPGQVNERGSAGGHRDHCAVPQDHEGTRKEPQSIDVPGSSALRLGEGFRQSG